jgi:hypothetical protein
MRVAKVESTSRFFTDSGIEVPALTADQMREVDRIAMEETGPNFFQMMENAGRNLAMLTIEVLGGGRKPKSSPLQEAEVMEAAAFVPAATWRIAMRM